MSTTEQKAAAWDTLMELCGHWQDGSQADVRLLQDDATCTCLIATGYGPNCRRFYVERGSFEAAIREAQKHLQQQAGYDPDL